jgi:DNA-binding LacI/PurR family transcriptional regulator
MPISLRDVAAHAGVSVRTVSNVANGFAHVAPDTRRRVQRAIDDLGYRPNTAARQLRRGRTETISLVVPEIASPYFAELASLTVRIAEERGWTVHIDQTDGTAERERRMIAGPVGQSVDGVICSPWAVDPEELSRLATGPLVLLGERAGAGRLDHVAIDNVAASAAATEHLAGLGRRRIAAVGAQPHLHNDTARLRLEGYRSALAAAGLPAPDELVVPVRTLHRPDGAAAMARLLTLPEPVDAVFCFTDELALGAVRTLAEHGLRVPHDVAVVGFDDIVDGRYAVPSLTTIAPDKEQLARLALDCLADRIADPDRPDRDLVAGHRLLVRESTGNGTGYRAASDRTPSITEQKPTGSHS